MHVIHASGSWSFAQLAAQSRLLLLAAHGQDFHGTIEIVSDPSREAQLARELPGSHDKRLARGDERRSGTGVGDSPSLDQRWQQFLSEDKATRELLDRAGRTQEESLMPVLPGAAPLVVADKVICRTPAGVAAFNLKDGRPAGHPTKAHHYFSFVMPAEAGIQGERPKRGPWIPAFAGMTAERKRQNQRRATAICLRRAGCP